MITATAQRVIRRMDAAFARVYLSLRSERNSMISFLFHSLFRDEREMELDLLDPLERTTLAHFRELIEYYLSHGYHFIGPEDLLKELPPGRNYAILTFDDGYYNNHLALPILEEFGIPAVFFISTDHMLHNKSFWWDSLYRHRRRQGASQQQIYREELAVKRYKAADIDQEMLARFGPDALKPVSDLDRPFSPRELAAFAAHPRVVIGNHTASHAILTNHTPDEIRSQICDAQTALTTVTGRAPIALAYPNGAHSRAAIDACRQAGVKVAFTTRPEKNVLPLSPEPDRLLQLGRFVPHNEFPIKTQCCTYRSDILLYGLFRDCYLRFCRGSIP